MRTTNMLYLFALAMGLNSFASAAQITFGVESGSSIKNGQVFTVLGKAQGVDNGFQKNILSLGQLSSKPLTVERISTANLGGAPSMSNQLIAQADGTRTQALGEVPANLGVILVGSSCSNYMGHATFTVVASRNDSRDCGESTGNNVTTCTQRSSVTAASPSACKSALSTASDVTLSLMSGSFSLSFNAATQVACAIISSFDAVAYDTLGHVTSERKSKQEYFDGDVAYCSCMGGTCTMGVI